MGFVEGMQMQRSWLIMSISTPIMRDRELAVTHNTQHVCANVRDCFAPESNFGKAGFFIFL